MTDKIRVVLVTLFAVSVLAALAGWLFWDRDPAKIFMIIGIQAGSLGIGEASNILKRVTWSAEAARMPSANPPEES